MLNIRASSASAPSESFREEPRLPGEDNAAWLARQLAGADPGAATLLLVGGVDGTAMRLRIAQSHVRDTLSPSHWSHVAMLATDASGPEPELVEIALDPPGGFGFAPPTNGVQRVSIETYADATRYPNVAVVHFAATDEQRGTLADATRRFQRQRSVLDATELVVVWLAFVWGVGRTGNPLLDGHGVPSAAMAEIVFGAAGYDLTPGLDSRASCPEAIWQSARWWHEYYDAVSPGGAPAPYGAWTVGHRLDFADRM